MKEEKQAKMKKSTKYLLIGVLVLFLSILGASMAYYLARVQGSLNGRAAGTELAIQVTKLSNNATGDLIPLDNDLDTLGQAALGYQDNGACVDINGYSVCQIYKITLTNNGSVPLTMNGTVTLSGQNTPNIDCATMSDATTVSNNNSCMGQNVFVSGDTLPANDHKDYFVMVYINNLDEPQTDSGAFNGVVTFTTEDGRKVKGRFTKPFNLVQRIETLYNINNNDLVTTTTKAEVTNNSIVYNYATSVGLMKDRLGGTSATPDSGNIRYYGESPNNYVDIGDKTEVAVERGNWLSVGAPFADETACNNWATSRNITNEQIQQMTNNNYTTVSDFCSVSTIPAGTPILWRIIGVFDGKLRIRRDESIGEYSFDTSAGDINDGLGINEWSQADLMKLLNPGYETNQDFDTDGTTKISVNNSLYWNSGTGKCYNNSSYANVDCDFTNSGLSEEAKEYIVDQTLYLGGFDTTSVFANEAYAKEKGSNIIQNPEDGITRTLSWTGKVGLIYPSDFGYAADLSNANCQSTLNSFSSCTANWMNGVSWTVSPWAEDAHFEMNINSGYFGGHDSYFALGGWPTLLLDSSVLAESGNGSKEHPYVVAY